VMCRWPNLSMRVEIIIDLVDFDLDDPTISYSPIHSEIAKPISDGYGPCRRHDQPKQRGSSSYRQSKEPARTMVNCNLKLLIMESA
jgi:hypothetical protein